MEQLLHYENHKPVHVQHKLELQQQEEHIHSHLQQDIPDQHNKDILLQLHDILDILHNLHSRGLHNKDLLQALHQRLQLPELLH